MTVDFVRHQDGAVFTRELADNSVRLMLTDPPFYGIVDEGWDNQWVTEEEFVAWLVGILLSALPKLTPDGSLIFFGGIGKHKSHPLFDVVNGLEKGGFFFRNWITWKKRRAYGKEYDYLFTREELLWFSKLPERDEVVFHKPYTAEIRGYAGFDPLHPAHSAYKRVSNVWTDIGQVWEDEDPGTVIDDVTELFKPKRRCQKPPRLIRRLIETHSDPGDLVADPFVGWGTTVIEALSLGRRALGSEMVKEDAVAANLRALAARS